jgi:hypothetical protein
MTVGTHHATRTRTPDFFFDGLENHVDRITLQITQAYIRGFTPLISIDLKCTHAKFGMQHKGFDHHAYSY